MGLKQIWYQQRFTGSLTNCDTSFLRSWRGRVWILTERRVASQTQSNVNCFLKRGNSDILWANIVMRRSSLETLLLIGMHLPTSLSKSRTTRGYLVRSYHQGLVFATSSSITAEGSRVHAHGFRSTWGATWQSNSVCSLTLKTLARKAFSPWLMMLEWCKIGTSGSKI